MCQQIDFTVCQIFTRLGGLYSLANLDCELAGFVLLTIFLGVIIDWRVVPLSDCKHAKLVFYHSEHSHPPMTERPRSSLSMTEPIKSKVRIVNASPDPSSVTKMKIIEPQPQPPRKKKPKENGKGKTSNLIQGNIK